MVWLMIQCRDKALCSIVLPFDTVQCSIVWIIVHYTYRRVFFDLWFSAVEYCVTYDTVQSVQYCVTYDKTHNAIHLSAHDSCWNCCEILQYTKQATAVPPTNTYLLLKNMLTPPIKQKNLLKFYIKRVASDK